MSGIEQLIPHDSPKSGLAAYGMCHSQSLLTALVFYVAASIYGTLAIQAKFKAVGLTASLDKAIISAAIKATDGVKNTDTGFSCLIWKVFGCYHRMMKKILICFLSQSLSLVLLYGLTCNCFATSLCSESPWDFAASWSPLQSIDSSFWSFHHSLPYSSIHST